VSAEDSEDNEPEDLRDCGDDRNSCPYTKWIVLYILYIQGYFHLSDNVVRSTLKFLCVFLYFFPLVIS
jgi:hypothetical protein